MAAARPPTGTVPGAAFHDRQDLALLVVLAVFWGSAFTVIRIGILAGISPLTLGAGRFALAAVLMAGIAGALRAPRPDRRTLLLGAAFGGLLTIGAYAAFLNLGEVSISSGLSAILIGTVPLWAAVFGAIALPGERLRPLGILGLAAGFAGVLVAFLPALLVGATASVLGDLSVLAAAVCGSAGAVALRRLIPGGIGLWTLTAQFAAATALLVGASYLPGQGHALPFDARAWEAIVYLAVVPSVLGYTIYFGLMHRGGVTRAALVAYLNPLAGLVLGVVLLGEVVTVSEIAGFGLILVGLLLFERARAAPRPPRAEAPEPRGSGAEAGGAVGPPAAADPG